MNKLKPYSFSPYNLLFLCLLSLAGCGTNPVTGKTELQLVSETQEVNIGRENYVPAQQSQGGPYAVDKELTRYVSAVGQKIAKVSDRPELPFEFVVLNNPVPNAWALPGGKIAVNRGLLLELNNEAELAAVLGHEIVHAAARHGAKSMERGILLNAGIVGLGVAASGTDNADLMVGAAKLGSQLISQKYGRDAELEADKYGMKYMAKAGYDPWAAVELQKTFVKLSKGQKSSWLDGLFASHPPSQERVDANIKTAKQLNTHGVGNRDIYQQKIARLKKDEPAYEKYEDAKLALKSGDTQKTLSLLDEAIAIEPREGLFYALKGDVYYHNKDFQQAEQAFNKAVDLNHQYFLFYLERGLAREKLRQYPAARTDIEKSVNLLPTAPAYYALGNIALDNNNVNVAKQNYAKAAQSDSAIGRQSAAAYARLDLPANPAKYFAYQGSVNGAGSVIVTIKNQSPLAVNNLEVVTALYTEQGAQVFTKRYTFAKAIAAGASVSVDTGVAANVLGKNGNIKVDVTRAAIAEPASPPSTGN
ncbi:MAG: M48 family metalloprotease [Gammaproteobacteria bacterium]|jgi:predicted Zn-dependent protease